MQFSVVAASARGIRKAMALRDPCALALSSGALAASYGRDYTEIEIGNEKVEVVPEFCYLGDMLSAGGGCELAAITRCKCAWDKFRHCFLISPTAICPF